MRIALAAHDEVLRQIIEALGGWLFKHPGGGVCAAFASPRSAVDAAVASIRYHFALQPLPWSRSSCVGSSPKGSASYRGSSAEVTKPIAHPPLNQKTFCLNVVDGSSAPL